MEGSMHAAHSDSKLIERNIRLPAGVWITLCITLGIAAALMIVLI
jgi:hypothetical protein